MLKYMFYVKWEDRIFNEEAKRCVKEVKECNIGNKAHKLG